MISTKANHKAEVLLTTTMQVKLFSFLVLCVFVTATPGAWKIKNLPTTKLKRLPRPTAPLRVITKTRCREVLEQVPESGLKLVRPVCVRLTENQLFDKLKKTGGYNPRYVAVNESEACKFVDLTTDEEPVPTWLRQTQLASYKKRSRLDDSTKEETLRRQKRMVPSGPGTVLRGCWSAGTLFGNTNFKRTCTECSATTQLAANVFPPFINEVVCHETDRLCSPTIGRCFQRVLKFTFLQSTGNFVKSNSLSASLGVDVFEEEWKDFDQDVRSCCDCRASSIPGRG